MKKYSYKTILLFSILFLGLLFYSDIIQLIHLVRTKATYSHLTLIPIISLYFIIIEKNKHYNLNFTIFSQPKPYLLTPLALGLILFCIPFFTPIEINETNILSIRAASFLCFSFLIITSFFGLSPIKNNPFPYFFLLLLIPIPTPIIHLLTQYLLAGSSFFTSIFFKILNIPFVKEPGYIFHLSDLTIKIADECSGIRSTIAMFIFGVLAGQIFLKNWKSKITFVLLLFPIVVIKNAIRITTLTLLGSYVKIEYLTSSKLHRNGGILFFSIALLLSLIFLFAIIKIEKKLSISKPDKKDI